MRNNLSSNSPSRLGVPAPRRRQRSTPATLVTVVGTAYLRLIEYLEIFPRAVILAIDVPEELAALRLRSHPDRYLYTISVGQEHTVQSIVNAHGTPAQKAALSKLPSAGSSEGMAQLRGVGAAAMRQLIKRHEIQRLLREQVIPMLSVLSGGEIPTIRHVHLQGTAGGMGSEGGIVLFDEVIDALLEDNQTVIHSEVHLMGDVSFNGPDFPRVRENSAGAVADWIVKCRRPASDRVWISLFGSELPPVGKHKALRDAFLLEQHHALMAARVASDLRVNRSNETVSGQWGNVRLVQSDHFRALSLKAIAADVAREHRPIVADVLGTSADLGRVHAFRWRVTTKPKPRESVDGALERVLDATAEELIDSISRAGVSLTPMPLVVLKDGRQLALDNVRATFATPLVTVGDTRERICLLRTCRLACRQERDRLLAETAQLDHEIARLERKAMKTLALLQGSWFLALLTSDERKIDKAFEALSKLQAAYDALHETEAKRDSVETSIGQLSTELSDLVKKLKQLGRLLRRALPQGDEEQQAPVIDARPVDDLFADMLDHVERRRDFASFVHLIAQGVQYVKPHGLAEIVGAPDTSAEAIVRAVVAGTDLVHGPFWGGSIRDDQARRFIVFPPVHPDLARGLEEHHQGLSDSFGGVAFADNASGSVNVVIAEVTSCRVLEDVWVPHYAKGLARAMRSDLRDMYVRDVATLTKFGLIEQEGDSQSAEVLRSYD